MQVARWPALADKHCKAATARHLCGRLLWILLSATALCVAIRWSCVRLSASRSPTPPPRPPPPPRFAILTTATADYAARFAAAIANKRQYAARWAPQVDFVLDLYPYHRHRRRRDGLAVPPHFNRIFAMLRLMTSAAATDTPPYDWIVFLDADAVVTNFSLPLSTFLPPPGMPAHVVVHDGPEINSGAVLVANTAVGRAFLRHWYALGTRYHQPSLDQTALWHLLYLCAAHAKLPVATVGALWAVADRYPCRSALLFGVRPNGSDEPLLAPAAQLRRVEACWRGAMHQLQRPYGRRRNRTDDVVHYHSGAIGFNYYASVGRASNCALRHPVQLWRPGDWMVQDSGRGLQNNYLTGVDGIVTVLCTQSPCIGDIWLWEEGRGFAEHAPALERVALLRYRYNRWRGRSPDDPHPVM
ncbi:hypothetical protein CDCA_CDCA13G3621 [Cyanidium caldarium]|uniref:Uncharacterized protein n=1 Tax=Cyanidium caldarium TaxID=2771 RepID=A0AAV9IZY0_CYACA|nr:hypothetical protein CDCA_CDCA13G3621 [Cyanidium caldarium]